jgi:hypothetical protein
VLARCAAYTLSGIAMWPRLELDPAGKIVADTRGPNGELATKHSSWYTVLPILPSIPPLQVEAGDRLNVATAVDLAREVDIPPRYTLDVTMGSGQ